MARSVISKKRVKRMAGGPLKAFPRSHRRISGRRFSEGAMAQEFGGTFVPDSHGCAAGVFATTTYCPEVAEDQEQVFGRDPLRQFTPIEEIADMSDPWELPRPDGDLAEYLDEMTCLSGLQEHELGGTILESPRLLLFLYEKAQGQFKGPVLRLLDRMTYATIRRFGIPKVIRSFAAAGVLKKLGELARAEVKQRRKDRRHGRGTATKIVGFMGLHPFHPAVR